MSFARLGFGGGWVCFGILAAGCHPPPKSPHITQLEQRVDQLAAENRDLGQRLAQRDEQIAALKKKLDDCLNRGPSPLADLFRPVRIEIVDRTGGADYDGKPGDDGVTVYLRPRDADGHVVKVPGEIKIVLYDLTEQGDPKEIGHYVINEPNTLRKAWYGGFLTDHYTIKCAWPPGVQPPASREVLVRATFIDAVTGDTHTATKQVKIEWVNRQ